MVMWEQSTIKAYISGQPFKTIIYTLLQGQNLQPQQQLQQQTTLTPCYSIFK